MTVTDSLDTLIGVTDHLMPVRVQEMLNMEASILAINTKLPCSLVKLFRASVQQEQSRSSHLRGHCNNRPPNRMWSSAHMQAELGRSGKSGEDGRRQARGSVENGTGMSRAARQPSKLLRDLQLAVLSHHPTK